MTGLDQKFCYTCGHLLGMHKRASYYNEETGEPIYFVEYNCPRRRWWHELFHAHPITRLSTGWDLL